MPNKKKTEQGNRQGWKTLNFTQFFLFVTIFYTQLHMTWRRQICNSDIFMLSWNVHKIFLLGQIFYKQQKTEKNAITRLLMVL